MAGCQVPTKAALSLPLLSWTGEKKKNASKGLWVNLRTRRDYPPATAMGKIDLTWGN